MRMARNGGESRERGWATTVPPWNRDDSAAEDTVATIRYQLIGGQVRDAGEAAE